MAESPTKKRKRGLDIEELAKIFEDEPKDLKSAWAELRELIESARKTTSYIPRVRLLQFVI